MGQVPKADAKLELDPTMWKNHINKNDHVKNLRHDGVLGADGGEYGRHVCRGERTNGRGTCW